MRDRDPARPIAIDCLARTVDSVRAKFGDSRDSPGSPDRLDRAYSRGRGAERPSNHSAPVRIRLVTPIILTMDHVRTLPTDKPKRLVVSPTRFRSLTDPESLREFAENCARAFISSRATAGSSTPTPRSSRCSASVRFANSASSARPSLFVDPSRRVEEIELLDRDGSVREFEIELRRPDGRHARCSTPAT